MNQPDKSAMRRSNLGLLRTGLQPQYVEGLRFRHFFARPLAVVDGKLWGLTDIGLEDRGCTPNGLGISAHFGIPDFHVEYVERPGFPPKKRPSAARNGANTDRHFSIVGTNSMPAPRSMAPDQYPRTIMKMRIGTQTANSNSTVQRVVRTMVAASE